MRLLALVLVAGCGSKPSCPAQLPPTHLVEGFCTDTNGFCFFDHDVPF